MRVRPPRTKAAKRRVRIEQLYELQALPRELVLASAGSGKTYHLSSRIIGLLARGTPPDEILASTFTRKAAGEILERVLYGLPRERQMPAWPRSWAGTPTRVSHSPTRAVGYWPGC